MKKMLRNLTKFKNISQLGNSVIVLNILYCTDKIYSVCNPGLNILGIIIRIIQKLLSRPRNEKKSIVKHIRKHKGHILEKQIYIYTFL